MLHNTPEIALIVFQTLLALMKAQIETQWSPSATSYHEDHFPWDTQQQSTGSRTFTCINVDTPTQNTKVQHLPKTSRRTCIWSRQTNAMTRTPLNKHNTRLCHPGLNDNETNKHGWRYCLLWATIPCPLLERPAIQPVSVSLYSILYPALIADL